MKEMSSKDAGSRGAEKRRMWAELRAATPLFRWEARLQGLSLGLSREFFFRI